MKLAKQGVYFSFQGEGALAGEPTTFIRLAGCDVGCPECDTDYRYHLSMTCEDIVTDSKGSWVWVTGGEPTLQPALPLLARLLKEAGFRSALATAGEREIPPGVWDFLSVSPHNPLKWIQRQGEQLNLVPGLNGLSLRDPSLLSALAGCEHRFCFKYCTPLEGDERSLEECKAFVKARSGWRLGFQAHKHWRVD